MENRNEFEKMSMKMAWTTNPDKIIVVNTILLQKVFRKVRNTHNGHSHIDKSYFLSFKKSGLFLKANATYVQKHVFEQFEEGDEVCISYITFGPGICYIAKGTYDGTLFKNVINVR